MVAFKQKRLELGYTQKEVMDLINCSKSRIYQWEQGFQTVPKDKMQALEKAKPTGRKVFKGKGGKLTPENVLEIVELIKQGKTYDVIGKIYKVKGTTIYGIFNGDTWGHVTGFKKNIRTLKGTMKPQQSQEPIIHKANCMLKYGYCGCEARR